MDPLPVLIWRLLVVAAVAALIYAVVVGEVAAGAALIFLLIWLAPAAYRQTRMGRPRRRPPRGPRR